MRRILILLSAVVLLMVAVVPAAAAGGDADCSEFTQVNLDPPIYLVENEVINGNLTVASGDGCVLIGSTLNGDLTAADGALFLEVVDGSTVNGNVEIGEDVGSFIFASAVHGNVMVNEGADSFLGESYVSGDFICDGCFFEDVVSSTVDGNVKIVGEEDGTWFINSTIGGSIQIEDSGATDFAFYAQDTTVEGNFEVKNSKGPIFLFDNNVLGDVSVVDNRIKKSGLFPSTPAAADDIVPWEVRDTTKKAEFLGNTVGGNFEFKDNRGGRALISDNVIAGNLTCEGNKRKPSGSGNTADNKEGQCSNL